ncbi:bifunctional helix-turn-helix transcriptional regulator/GNAT family N-acetyltransferase [Devosia sp. SL43]|uniref:bifunctional helix-turn-helix transcriptional regulator/GNAT family N-acetyltransferase n=1 Tax=Devosia sp. SL43 TaxID=2806348 RepID=UPI001F21452F|nr:bifunctional helix-turn-helix transcriptional regulator/GNAT family N-acetyltransferase [Devosia sp. SL43]UJW84883.1 GNAT family N-acetyltransferase [Devosia sp. SL43]
MADQTGPIAEIRAFNRFYTKVMGLLEDGMHESPFTLAEARVVYELGKRGVSTVASELARDLAMDPGQLSRLVRRLDSYGLLSITPVRGDKRANNLTLTPRGDAVYQGFDSASNAAVSALIAPLDDRRRRDLIESMARIHTLLATPRPSGPIVLRSHRIGELGWLIHRQGLLYNEQFGWNIEFEALIAGIYSQFQFAPDAPAKDLWVAEQDGGIVGSIFVMPSEGLPGSAQLRMLYVEPSARGQGIGATLVSQAVSFARGKGYERMRLWTHTNQTSAGKLYAGAGFQIVETMPEHNFGKELMGEIWEMRF